jgi:membrane fusion protein (multidrug efflux system)
MTLLRVMAPMVALSLVACNKQAAQPPAVPPSVQYVTVEDRPVTLTTQLPGRTSAYETSDVRPQVNGLLEARLFTEGDLVHQGQPLYRIDASPS